jgi:hypothetical protein
MAHRRGTSAAYQSVSSDPRLRCVFEDDGGTGYLYALDHTDGSAQPIKDAVNIYTVDTANDLDATFDFQWSDDGQRCVMKLDGEPVAIVDFQTKQLSARSNFPRTSPWTGMARVPWTLPPKAWLEG